MLPSKNSSRFWTGFQFISIHREIRILDWSSRSGVLSNKAGQFDISQAPPSAPTMSPHLTHPNGSWPPRGPSAGHPGSEHLYPRSCRPQPSGASVRTWPSASLDLFRRDTCLYLDRSQVAVRNREMSGADSGSQVHGYRRTQCFCTTPTHMELVINLRDCQH